MEPPLSIGLPVFDGGRHLRETMESLLAQSFGDFRLLVSDNSSTDDTVSIAEEFARRDRRVEIVRNPTNRGAAWNFNDVFRRCRSTYFKWAAADDLLEPDFLRRCLDLLETREDCEFAFSRYRLIDEWSETIDDPPPAWAWPHRLASPDPVERFEDSLVDLVGSRVIFGVFRRRALARSPLIRPFAGSDRGLLTRLLLRAPLAEAGEVLFSSRRDATCATVRFGDDFEAWSRWFDPRNARRIGFPRWRLLAMDFHSILASPLSNEQKDACLAVLRRRTLDDPYMGTKLREDLRTHLALFRRRWIPGSQRSAKI